MADVIRLLDLVLDCIISMSSLHCHSVSHSSITSRMPRALDIMVAIS